LATQARQPTPFFEKKAQSFRFKSSSSSSSSFSSSSSSSSSSFDYFYFLLPSYLIESMYSRVSTIREDAACTWIYPTNYPVREYQLEICKQALFTNTLVCLPTGLGKTLIAAVVMYNFYRWYPQGIHLKADVRLFAIFLFHSNWRI
jgi:superfamily II DNA or RNA helicase